MSLALIMLVCSAVLALLMPVTYGFGRSRLPGGLEWGLSNRDRPFEGTPPWVARAERAHRNLVENLVPFGALVLSAYVSGRVSSLTDIGAVLFFLARVAHAAVYVAGLTPVRTLVFFVGTIGQLLILIALF